jgi:putative PIN family toxin of toxin-antitoxin system
MKIVLDTNVLISALIKEGKPRDLLSLTLVAHELIISREILEEVATVANEPRIRKYLERVDVADFLRDIATKAAMVRLRSRFKEVKDDPDDDMILRTAIDGRASYIVSGDSHLLALKRFRRVSIISVSDALEKFK